MQEVAVVPTGVVVQVSGFFRDHQRFCCHLAPVGGEAAAYEILASILLSNIFVLRINLSISY